MPTDIAIQHDPQTAGLVDSMRAGGATAIWRRHALLVQPSPSTSSATDATIREAR